MESDLDRYRLEALADAALSAAGPCEHADIRVMATRTSEQSYRDRAALADTEEVAVSMGVRVLRDGSWGFSATTVIDPDSAAAAARSAADIAGLLSVTNPRPVTLADEPTHTGEWSSSYSIDPFDLPSDERMAFLARGCEVLLADGGIDHVQAASTATSEEVFYTDTGSTRTRQRRLRVMAEFTGTLLGDDGSFETLRTTAPPVGRGWEYFRPGPGSWDWADELGALPDRLAEKSRAPGIEPGRYTLVLDPTNLWLVIHESVGHATELDRVRGYEANYAGTSFATEDQLGKLRYGSDLMNVSGDRTTQHGLATVAWDDEGVAAQRWPLISEGTLVDYQLDRSMAGSAHRRSNGCGYADSGLHLPLQRMPNVSLAPDPTGGDVADLIAGVTDGIYVVGDNSWSIDMQRYNFQFSGQRFERIRNGRLVGQVRDVAYQGTTTGFWGSLTALGGPETYLLAGALNCGKGQPGQVAPVSHGCPAAVFESVNIHNTSEEAS